MSASQFEPIPMISSEPPAAAASAPSEESNPIRDAIVEAIGEHKVILFMKGTPEAPACGFSARTVAILQSLDAPFAAVDILPDPRIRQELSTISNWPTIPQLFVDGELVGGCDIVDRDVRVRGARQDIAVASCAAWLSSRSPLTAPTTYPARSLSSSAYTRSACMSAGRASPSEKLEMNGFDAFYERLGRDPELPITSQPSIGDFLTVWEPLLEEGKDVVSVHLAGGVSGTCEAARQAHGLLAERGLGERVAVIDGETACRGGTGLLLLAAAAAANAGADKDAVAARVRDARKMLRIWFCLDT